MSDLVRARVSAVKELAHGLTTYERALDQAVGSARSDLNAASAKFSIAVAKAQTEFDRATRAVEGLAQELSRCREGCDPIQRRLAEARVVRDLAGRRLQTHRQAQDRCERACSELRSSMGTVDGAAKQTVPAARNAINSYADTLAQYLARPT